jgi:glycogen operon protein
MIEPSLERIDILPTHVYGGWRLRRGRPLPFGATLVPGGVNFSIFSRHATRCTLVLFEKHAPRPMAEIPFSDEFRIGNVFAMVVFGVDWEELEYGFRMEGPFSPEAGHRFAPARILMDPYARAIGGRDVWGAPRVANELYPHRARLAPEDFDWEDDRPLETPMEELVIYEMHVRGFTRHPSSGVRHPGTFAAIREKLPYLRELGVNCLELLPIFEFDEWENSRRHPETGQLLMNYWGYSTVGFFAPKQALAASGPFGMQVDELKALVKELHREGIEVMLDVVFNHTAEGNENGPTLHFRGIDNKTYYMLTPDGRYFNFSGTGNTLNCNHPIVRGMVLDCLRYWAAEYHIDGFRFDLAAILGRAQDGAPLANPPLLESLAFDPVLAKCKLVAEAWDAGGLYQVGSFPAFGRWAEWNGKYRDAVRRFLKGDAGLVPEIATRLMGSPDLYERDGRGATASVNFVTCHDGFTLHDLVSYDRKHNDANGEHGADGADDNHSWNCGVEGETGDEAVNALRVRQMKNAAAILLASRGVPMILMGDEVARTQGGNNNAYCQDGEVSWLDWRLFARHRDLFRFFSRCIAFRRAHPVLRGAGGPGGAAIEVSWHGARAWDADWSPESRALALLLRRLRGDGGAAGDEDAVYLAMNMHWEARGFALPAPPEGLQWHVFANTGASPPEDVWEPGQEPPLEHPEWMLMGARSVAILVGRRPGHPA